MAIFAALNFNINKTYTVTDEISMRSFTGRNIDSFTNELEDINWHQVFDHNTTADPLISYDNTFSTKLEEVMNNHFPLKDVKFNKYKHKKSKWMTYELLAKIKKRDKLYLEVHMTSPNSNINKLKLTELENKAKEVRKLKREAKATYYNLQFSKYRNDIRKTWENIADVINKSKIQKQFPIYFNVNETKITNKKEIATQFNNFFINIGPHLANKLNTNGKPSFKSYLKKRTNDTNFQFTPVSENYTKHIINNLKSKRSMGIDNSFC